jgi:hydrogenase expression/formation protein HypD
MNEITSSLEKLALGRRAFKIMEFCGGHTHSLVNSGLMSLLPKTIRMIHGPGCPVCVLPAHHIQAVIDLLETTPNLTVCVYGDLLRIPTLRGDSLAATLSRGNSVKMVYSPLDVIRLAESTPHEEFLFMAIGFETTAPATATLLMNAKARQLKNLSVFCLHVLTPPAIAGVMEALDEGQRPDALLAPGHVSMVTGLEIYREFSERYRIPIVVSGFEGADLLESIRLACECLIKKEYGVFNQYTRALPASGNLHAQRLLTEIFEVRPTFIWRGLGELKNSALALRELWAPWDAERRFLFQYRDVPEHPACRCGSILRGQNSPPDCRLFMKACTPASPVGSCMVSSEGACHAYYLLNGGVQ